MRLYHGSNVAIEHPDIAHNTGFADLGHGFYLTDDAGVARSRAVQRARGMGGSPTVSVFELDEACVPWALWGAAAPTLKGAANGPFGLRFETSTAGIAAWANYIKACRAGHTEVPGLGRPVVVRAWIATLEVEMVCSDFAPADELAASMDPDKLAVQYCLLDQGLIDRSLAFEEALPV